MNKTSPPVFLRPGVYQVQHDDRAEIVFVAGDPRDPWAFWNGHVFHGGFGAAAEAETKSKRAGRIGQTLAAPMPATVVKVLIGPGAIVKKGDAMIVLEAMKMELPLRASADGTVTAVHCREGELVQPETILVELT